MTKLQNKADDSDERIIGSDWQLRMYNLDLDGLAAVTEIMTKELVKERNHYYMTVSIDGIDASAIGKMVQALRERDVTKFHLESVGDDF
jgi:hypothetical protein